MMVMGYNELIYGSFNDFPLTSKAFIDNYEYAKYANLIICIYFAYLTMLSKACV